MSKKIKTQLAREFRKNPTKSEKIMWNALRNRQFLGLKFRRQYLAEGYILDFYCHELNLAIEIDGLIHLRTDQIKYDKERQRVLENKGIRFIRINSGEVELNLVKVLENIKLLLTKS